LDIVGEVCVLALVLVVDVKNVVVVLKLLCDARCLRRGKRE
jgi:hypothetical protein